VICLMPMKPAIPVRPKHLGILDFIHPEYRKIYHRLTSMNCQLNENNALVMIDLMVDFTVSCNGIDPETFYSRTVSKMMRPRVVTSEIWGDLRIKPTTIDMTQRSIDEIDFRWTAKITPVKDK